MSLGTTFDGLPTWAKGVIAVAGTAAAAAIGYGIYIGLKKRMQLADARKEQDVVEDEIAKMKK